MPRTLRKRVIKPTVNESSPPVSPAPRDGSKLVSPDSVDSEDEVTVTPPPMPKIVGSKLSRAKHSGLLAKDQEQR